MATAAHHDAVLRRADGHGAPPHQGLLCRRAAGKNVAFSPVSIDASGGGLNKAFQDVAAKSYKSEARTVSFTKKPEEAVEMINCWVKKATNGLVECIFSPADTDLVLANAVYFKGKWLNPFESHNTRADKFHRLDGSHVEADFLWEFHSMYVSYMDGFKVLKLPYRKGHCSSDDDTMSTRSSMFVFLPDNRDGMATMVDVITAAPAYLYSLLPTETKPVRLKLPKFEISFNWDDFSGDLCRLGLSLPFLPKVADLRGMFAKNDGRPTFLSKVAHKAVVKVNEEGTEAAAVYGALLGGGGPPPDTVEFVADHPFTFLIMEEISGVIVFAGHVIDPTRK